MLDSISGQTTFDKYTVINHQPFSKYISSILNANSEHGHVLNLNASWGAGKTTFLHCWYNELKTDHPVIYFDAWKSDFSKDPMLALVDCFQEQLKNPLSSNKALLTQFVQKGSYFFKRSLPSLAVGYLKHKTNVPGDESFLESASERLGLEINSNDSADAMKEVLKAMCEQREQVNGINKLKEVLEKMAQELISVSQKTDAPKQYPVYVLIDELDRCRPNYAIEVIESIKHFFDTKHFVFVLATDTDQLQHSIKAVYGNGFDAHSYLSRFFHRSVTLPAPSIKNYLRVHLPPIIGNDFDLGERYVLDILVKIFRAHRMNSLREIDKVLQDLEVAKSTGQRFKILPLTILSVLKRTNPDMYYRYVKTGNTPYPSFDDGIENKNEPSETEYSNPLTLERNWAVEDFHFNEHGEYSVDIHRVFAVILSTMRMQGALLEFEDIEKEKFDRTKIVRAIQDITLRYHLNPAGLHPISKLSTPMRTDYFDVLELGGHLDFP